MGAQHLWQQLGTTKGSIRFMSKGKKTKKGGREGHIQHHHHPWDEPHEHGDVDDVVNFEKVKKNMSGGVVNFSRALSQMRPGKADAGVFDALHVTAYGQHVPLAQVAQVTVSGTHSLSVNIYDPAVCQLQSIP
jgi:hypothetical protein